MPTGYTAKLMESGQPLPASGLFCVGLPDTQGGMCWLAGYESDPTRYYTPSTALRFKTRSATSAAIVRATRTHPGRERTYLIMRVSEMETQNAAMSDCAGGKLNS